MSVEITALSNKEQNSNFQKKKFCICVCIGVYKIIKSQQSNLFNVLRIEEVYIYLLFIMRKERKRNRGKEERREWKCSRRKNKKIIYFTLKTLNTKYLSNKEN